MSGLHVSAELLSREGFVHGFSTRLGGVSEAPFDSLNLGRKVGDVATHVEENRRRFAQAVGFDAEVLHELSQVHGATVHVVRPGDDPGRTHEERADALVAAGGEVAIGIGVADCIPLLLADRRNGAVGAVHAGWRGCVAGVIGAAVAVLTGETGGHPSEVLAAIGPHIRRGHFEVGPDVAQELDAAAPGVEVVHEASGDTPHVDLAAVARAQLQQAGIAGVHIADVGGCTYGEPARFFSYRRDGARSGRHLGVIRPRGNR